MKTLHEILNEGMQLQWDYLEDGSPSAFTNIDGGRLEVVYTQPQWYTVMFNGTVIAPAAFSLKSGMKTAERVYRK